VITWEIFYKRSSNYYLYHVCIACVWCLCVRMYVMVFLCVCVCVGVCVCVSVKLNTSALCGHPWARRHMFFQNVLSIQIQYIIIW
jgi:hypothetical protein